MKNSILASKVMRTCFIVMIYACKFVFFTIKWFFILLYRLVAKGFQKFSEYQENKRINSNNGTNNNNKYDDMNRN